MAALTAPGRVTGPRGFVVISDQVDNQRLLQLLSGGARGFLAEANLEQELEPAVRAVHRGHAALSPEYACRLLNILLPVQQSGGNILTKRELDVLTLVGAGHTNQEIAALCHISVSTVRTHIDHLRAKLCVSNRVQLALAARLQGLGY